MMAGCAWRSQWQRLCRLQHGLVATAHPSQPAVRPQLFIPHLCKTGCVTSSGQAGGGCRHPRSLCQPGMEGPRSSATVANFKTRCAARRPICAVLARPWQPKEVQSCPKKREISARRGSRTRRRGSVMPLRGNLFKTMSQFSYV